MADKTGGLTFFKGSDLNLQVQVGTEWREISGGARIVSDAPQAPVNTIRAFRRKGSITGEPEIGVITIDLGSYIPNTSVDDLLDKAYRPGGETHRFRVETNPDLLFTAPSTATAALTWSAADETLTLAFAGTGQQVNLAEDTYGVGNSIKIGTGATAKFFVIDYIPGGDTEAARKTAAATLSRTTLKQVVVTSGVPAETTIGANVTAATYSIGIETRRWEFSADVAQYSGFEASSDEAGTLTGTLVLAPTAQIAQPDRVGGF